MGAQVHPTAEVSPLAQVGDGTRIWHHAQVRERAVLGEGCIVGKDAYIDTGVVVGRHCKIQNGAYLYHGVVLEDGVFIGPRVTTTNDRLPRAIRADGVAKGAEDWEVVPTRICRGASIGAGAVLICGITVGPFALVAAGSVVTRDVPEMGLVMGNPARLRGAVCPCGTRLVGPVSGQGTCVCPACGEERCLPEEVAAVLRVQEPGSVSLR